MASNVLRLVFKHDASDKKMTFNFGYAKAAPQEADVKALGAAMIANKDIYEDKPGTLLGAEVVVTTNTPININ